MDELLIREYLSKKGITIIGQCFHHDKNITHKDIISQINLIVKLHKVLVGCSFSGLSGIKSTIGKEIEDYKVQIKKLEMYYDHIVNKSCHNEVDRLILANGKTMLKKAKETVSYIYEHDYFGVIRRSMNREELCLEKVQPNNLRRNEDKIEIGIIKDMTYNLVEEDLYNYIKKLQRAEMNIDEEELIKVFIYESHLSFNSFDYLRGLCNYPRGFLRVWMKYVEMKSERNTLINKVKINENEINHGKSNEINDWKNSVINGQKNNEINKQRVKLMDNEQDKFNEKSKINRKNKTNEELLLEFEKSLKYESKSFIKSR